MSFPLKQLKVVLVSLEDQGCSVKRVKSGYLIFLPNGEKITFHISTSDHRAVLNMRSRVRRAGLKWPFD